jgi:hypothetical protein
MKKDITPYELTDKDKEIIKLGTKAERRLKEIQKEDPGSDRHKKFLERFYSWDRNIAGKITRKIAFKYGILRIDSGSYYMMNGRPFPMYKALENLPMITDLENLPLVTDL